MICANEELLKQV